MDHASTLVIGAILSASGRIPASWQIPVVRWQSSVAPELHLVDFARWAASATSGTAA
jgi:hypothetical protein